MYQENKANIFSGMFTSSYETFRSCINLGSLNLTPSSALAMLFRATANILSTRGIFSPLGTLLKTWHCSSVAYRCINQTIWVREVSEREHLILIDKVFVFDRGTVYMYFYILVISLIIQWWTFAMTLNLCRIVILITTMVSSPNLPLGKLCNNPWWQCNWRTHHRHSFFSSHLLHLQSWLSALALLAQTSLWRYLCLSYRTMSTSYYKSL